MDLPDSDRGDLSCRCAVDSSSFSIYYKNKNVSVKKNVGLCR